MRLGFHYHVPAASKPDGIYMPGYLGRFVDSLAAQCESVVCFQHSPRPDEVSRMDYRIKSPNVELVNIGCHASVPERMLFSWCYTRFLRQYAGKLDALLVRGPSPLLPSMVSASPVPTALLLVGDYLNGIDDLPQPRWRKEAIRLWSRWNKWEQTRAARHSLTFVNSRILYNELQPSVPTLHEVRTTTLTEDDFFLRPDTCQSAPPYRLLYVGRMDRGKGLLQMIDAVSLLVQRGEDVLLDFVGWCERGDPILDDLQKLACMRAVQGRVNYLGMRSLGPELFACYQTADIYMIASVASEGFPRTIWEAMAHSLPVIATRVGSIPAFIDGAAELVLPADPEALADAVRKLIHRPDFRQRYIERGLTLARANTLEACTPRMVEIIQTWLEESL